MCINGELKVQLYSLRVFLEHYSIYKSLPPVLYEAKVFTDEAELSSIIPSFVCNLNFSTIILT